MGKWWVWREGWGGRVEEEERVEESGGRKTVWMSES